MPQNEGREVFGGGVTLVRLQAPSLARQTGGCRRRRSERPLAEKNLVRAAGEAEPQIRKNWVHGMAGQPCGARILGGGGGGLSFPRLQGEFSLLTEVGCTQISQAPQSP